MGFVLSAPNRVDECELNKCSEDETDAAEEPDFTCFDVGHLG